MIQLTGNEYLDVRAVSPQPFRTAETAGLVKTTERQPGPLQSKAAHGRDQPVHDGPLVSIDAQASDVLALVSEFRQKLAMLNRKPLGFIGDRLKIRQ